MSTMTLNTVLRLRKDTEANYEAVKSTFIPANGEVCLVDTGSVYGTRIKIGDGVHTFAELEYADKANNVILRGYYLNGNFYTDSTYTVALEKGVKHLYVDLNSSGKTYLWDGSKYVAITPEATAEAPGIMKLYQTPGQATDGTMSQKTVTDGVNAIKFAIEETPDEDGDGEPENVLVLDLPWD